MSTDVQDALQSDLGRHDRPAWRGARARMISPPAGDVRVQIPALRMGRFFPDLLRPRRRVDVYQGLTVASRRLRIRKSNVLCSSPLGGTAAVLLCGLSMLSPLRYGQ